jgi:hypothetical protein
MIELRPTSFWDVLRLLKIRQFQQAWNQGQFWDFSGEVGEVSQGFFSQKSSAEKPELM